MNLRGWLPAVGASIVIVLGTWIVQLFAPVDVMLPRTTDDPDYFAERIAVTSYDESGRVQHRLDADFMAHRPLSDTLEVQAPRLEAHRPGAPPWILTAQRANSVGPGETLAFVGDVRVERAGFSGQPPASLTTRELRLDRSGPLLYTEEPVRLTQGNAQLEGTGLRLQLGRNGSLEILSGVRGVYATP